MKKIFGQPELMVVRMNNKDIVTESIMFDKGTSTRAEAGDRLGREYEDSWDAGY